MTEKHVSTLVINPSGGQDAGSSSVKTTSSSTFSSSSQASKSVSSTKSSNSSSTKTVSTSSTVKKSSTTSVKSMKMSSTTSSILSSSDNNIAIKSSSDSFMDRFGKDFGVDVNQEMERMKISMDEAVKKAREEMFSLTKLESGGKDIVKLDNNSIMSFVDKADSDRLKFNFDVDEFESESIVVNAVGNQIEVHGKKKVRKGEDETSEEFSRTYEMPSQQAIDAGSVTTSFFKDGILTVELPFDAKAIEDKKV